MRKLRSRSGCRLGRIRGNAQEDVFRGPAIDNWDALTLKNFFLTERFKVQSWGESYNTFDPTQFSGGSTTAEFDPKTGLPGKQ
jgi:hypothetical protein